MEKSTIQSLVTPRLLMRHAACRASSRILRTLLLTVLSALFFAASGHAQSSHGSEAAVPDGERAPSLGDALQNLGRVYKNDNDEILQEWWLLGRYHGQYHWTEATTGESEFYETRRFRLGSQARLFRKVTLHAQMVSGSDIDPFYNGFTELWAQWSFTPEFNVTIGQQKHRFTHDRNVSSRYLNYLERAMLTNMFNADYTPALTIQGKID